MINYYLQKMNRVSIVIFVNWSSWCHWNTWKIQSTVLVYFFINSEILCLRQTLLNNSVKQCGQFVGNRSKPDALRGDQREQILMFCLFCEVSTSSASKKICLFCATMIGLATNTIIFYFFFSKPERKLY